VQEQSRRNIPDLTGASGLVKFGGSCILDRPRFREQNRETGELQSWWNEFAGFNGKTTKQSHKRVLS
jgi:hypothetical protein